MVVDMLTSPQEQIPPCVAPMEENRRDSTAALCLSSRGDRHPQDAHHAPDFHCSGHPGGSSSSGDPKTSRTDRSDGGDRSEPQRTISSERRSTECHEDRDESRHRPPTRSCKRKLALTSLSLGSEDMTKAQDAEKKGPESPPPAKRWVIGPLFQSFKSKMASFTEIVMSPVRLFKPNESNGESPSAARDSKEEEENDDTKDAFRTKQPTKMAVVQRLSFDTDQSNVYELEQIKDSVMQKKSKHGQDGGSSTKSTNWITEEVGVSDRVAMNPQPISRAGSPNGASFNKGSVKAVQESDGLNKNAEEKNISQDENQPKKLRLPTPAVGKRKKGRGPERRELAERMEKELDREEESPTVTPTRSLEKPSLIKRRKVQVSDECVDACRSAVTRASRRRSKKENVNDITVGSSSTASPDLLGTDVTNDPTPPGGPTSSASGAWAGSRKTRQRKTNKERKSDVAQRLCSDSEERLRFKVSKPSRMNDIRRATHESDTSAAKKMTRGQRAVDSFEDQGMSMSLTLKLGSGLDGEKDASAIMSCGITTSGKKTEEGTVLTDTSCLSREAPEDPFCIEDADTDVTNAGAGQKRRWFVYSEIREDDEVEQEDETKEVPTWSDSMRLKRSLSCPDIASLHHSRPSPPKNATHLIGDVPSPLKRTRRHTVCSVEIEREIAPLCLRKEVYPKWGGAFRHSHPQSQVSSFASLVSCFLSSPLAFLSRKSAPKHGNLAAAAASSSPPTTLSSASSRTASGSASFTGAPRTPDKASVSSHCSVFDDVSMEVEEVFQRGRGKIRQPAAVAEERALSDSEIKSDIKHLERRKVSSIRIRKTLPKPQHNLTPMGLPKTVRIKKKVFSVEEIYTNKNFIRPAEGRLETIFEVPLSRRDGSQSLIGPKRVKRFVEFPEVGVARKPRRHMIGGAGVGGAQRKAAVNPGTGRTRRCREAEALHLHDLNSLLCSKLNELDVWMSAEQSGH